MDDSSKIQKGDIISFGGNLYNVIEPDYTFWGRAKAYWFRTLKECMRPGLYVDNVITVEVA